MHPTAMVKHRPKCIDIECAQVRRRQSKRLDAFFIERKREMMMIDDVGTSFRPRITGIMWSPRNLPIFFGGRLRKRSRLSLTHACQQ
jgi:hypothetical protein